MDGKHSTFVHSLLFRCEECKQPLAMCVISTERNGEDVDGNSFDLLCECGWSRDLLGMQAIRHWVTPWLDGDLEDPKTV
jgi:hypothetical protein